MCFSFRGWGAFWGSLGGVPRAAVKKMHFRCNSACAAHLSATALTNCIDSWKLEALGCLEGVTCGTPEKRTNRGRVSMGAPSLCFEGPHPHPHSIKKLLRNCNASAKRRDTLYILLCRAYRQAPCAFPTERLLLLRFDLRALLFFSWLLGRTWYVQCTCFRCGGMRRIILA